MVKRSTMLKETTIAKRALEAKKQLEIMVSELQKEYPRLVVEDANVASPNYWFMVKYDDLKARMGDAYPSGIRQYDIAQYTIVSDDTIFISPDYFAEICIGSHRRQDYNVVVHFEFGRDRIPSEVIRPNRFPDPKVMWMAHSFGNAIRPKFPVDRHINDYFYIQHFTLNGGYISSTVSGSTHVTKLPKAIDLVRSTLVEYMQHGSGNVPLQKVDAMLREYPKQRKTA